MTIHKSGNYCLGQSVSHLKSGDTIQKGNYSQISPNTDVFKGIENITVLSGNFVNCKKPVSWIVEGGNWAQVSRCGHLHPKWVEAGLLSACEEDCVHKQGTIKQWVNINETEYRKEKNSIIAIKPVLQTNTTFDKDGVFIQEFQKEIFVYEDKLELAQELAQEKD